MRDAALVELVPGSLAYFVEESSIAGTGDRNGDAARVADIAGALGARVRLLHVEQQWPWLLRYEPYFLDFGPISLSHTTRFCAALRSAVDDASARHEVIVVVLALAPDVKAMQVATNVATMLGVFAVLELGATHEQLNAAALPADVARRLISFHDASPHDDFTAVFELTVVHVAAAVLRATECGIFDVASFDPDEFDHFERVENGDVNWIIPGRLLATSSPEPGDEWRMAALHRSRGVVHLVQLNEADYALEPFELCGIQHHDLVFPDGGVPPLSILAQFFAVIEDAWAGGGAVAVHCKAGLGRTGTLACAVLIRHFGFSAREAIAWCRLCRPGSVIGPQQHYLCWVEHQLKVGSLAIDEAQRHDASTGDPQGRAPAADCAADRAADRAAALLPAPRFHHVPSPMLARYASASTPPPHATH